MRTQQKLHRLLPPPITVGSSLHCQHRLFCCGLPLRVKCLQVACVPFVEQAAMQVSESFLTIILLAYFACSVFISSMLLCPSRCILLECWTEPVGLILQHLSGPTIKFISLSTALSFLRHFHLHLCASHFDCCSKACSSAEKWMLTNNCLSFQKILGCTF